MTMAHSVRAVYEDGWLKPLEPLPLSDRQHVEIMVTVLEEPRYRADPERVRQLHGKADEWLAEQPTHAVQKPKCISQVERDLLDIEFDQLMKEIQSVTSVDDEVELTALVNEAVMAVRKSHA